MSNRVTSGNNNNNSNTPGGKGRLLYFIIVAAIFLIGLAVTGNLESFLPFLDWGDDTSDGSSYSQEIEYNDSDADAYEEDATQQTSAPATESTTPQTTTTAQTTTTVQTTTEQTTTTAQTTAAPEPEKVEITYYFRNRSTYESHYEKHGAEFGNITLEEYLQMANELIASDADTVLTKYADDGDFMYFDTATGYFLVLSPDDYIRTFFVPDDGIEYWDRQ